MDPPFCCIALIVAIYLPEEGSCCHVPVLSWVDSSAHAGVSREVSLKVSFTVVFPVKKLQQDSVAMI